MKDVRNECCSEVQSEGQTWPDLFLHGTSRHLEDVLDKVHVDKDWDRVSLYRYFL